MKKKDVLVPQSPVAGAMLVIVFAMLWVPVGQHDFLLLHWMKVGTFMAPFLLLVAFAFRDAHDRTSIPQLFAALMLIAYIAHQFEEHWIDLYGNVFAFQGSVNTLILGVLGVEPISAIEPEILTRASIFAINTSLVWLVGALAIWSGAKLVAPVLAMIGIAFVNGISHIMSGLAMGAYNPGLVTSIFIFIPLCIFFYRALWRGNFATGSQIAWSLAWSVAAHVIMVAGVIAANWWRLFPELVYFVLLVVWSSLPAAWSWTKRAEESPAQ